MDTKSSKERPEQLPMQYEELLKSIDDNMRFILEAIKVSHSKFIEEGVGDPQRLLF